MSIEMTSSSPEYSSHDPSEDMRRSMLEDFSPTLNSSSGSGDTKVPPQANTSYNNFVLFCVLYSVTHAAVDAVVAYSTAELGPLLGSYGGFSLYIAYTLSSLLVAKPFLRTLGAKNTVLLGLIGNLVYVASFFIALSVPSIAVLIFILGAIIGGIGSGLLWTGQGSYYSLNAREYNNTSDGSSDSVLVYFASIFSGIYLGLEALFGALATITFIVLHKNSSWKSTIFGVYTSVAVVSVTCFWRFVKSFELSSNHDVSTYEPAPCSPKHNDDDDEDSDCSLDPTHPYRADMTSKDTWHDIWTDLSAVARGLIFWRRLQLITPYQICFGLSAGLVNYYVNGFIVKEYLGDGYIGILAAVTTVTATFSSIPFVYIANHPRLGKWYVIMFSGICFVFNGLVLLLFTNKQLGSWSIMVPYFFIHGAARGAWESTNKAVVADYYRINVHDQEVAFAAIYFSSGLAGAFGYFFYQYISGRDIALLNTVVGTLGIICYHLSFKEPVGNDNSLRRLMNDNSYSIQTRD